jgi:predicted LPLAT superfamily acyltransferase
VKQSEDPGDRAGAPKAAEWRRSRERGSRILLRAMAFVSLKLGRPTGRVILYLIAGYFFCFAPTARYHMRGYLRRALGREPSAADRFRLVLNFATTIHDRLYLLAGRFAQFEVTAEGEELFHDIIAQGRGAVLMGAHMGGFEVLRSLGASRPGLSIVMVMYEENARKLNAVMASAKTRDPPEIIPLGHVDTMLRIRSRLDQGAMLGILADRRLGAEAALPIGFLGATAMLPIGPMRAAALLRRPVVFMLGLYRGGNRYHVVFEPIADFSGAASAPDSEVLARAIERYVALLEKYCRSDPYNWFNFFDFWPTEAAIRAGGLPAVPRHGVP